MSKKIGIEQNTEQRIIAGCRVAYDPRTTAEADSTRSPKNRKADEKPLRTWAWQHRNKHQEAAE